MDDLVIRSVEDSDEPFCDAIYDACVQHRPSVKATNENQIGSLLDPSQQNKWKKNGWPVLVATRNGIPVGLGCLKPLCDWMEPTCTGEVLMIVDPTLHRQSIASHLWKALLEHPAVTAKRLHVIMARTSWDNAPAINACLKAGFRQTGGLQNIYFENTSNTLRGEHYFEKIVTPYPPIVSDLGWPPAYSGKARVDQIVKNLSDKDVHYRYLSSDDGDMIQAVSDYLAATELWPLRSTLYPSGYGQRMVERMMHTLSPTVVLFDKKSRTIVGWANFLCQGHWSGLLIATALFTLNLPSALMEPEVVSQIWNMLVEANQASGDLRVSNIYCFAARDDRKRRQVLEEMLKMKQAYTSTSDLVKFGRLHSSITYQHTFEHFSREQATRYKASRAERSTMTKDKDWDRRFLPPLDPTTPPASDSTGKWLSWFGNLGWKKS